MCKVKLVGRGGPNFVLREKLFDLGRGGGREEVFFLKIEPTIKTRNI